MIGLIACGSAKLSVAAPARDLYTGSLFVVARAYVEARCSRWGILSAKHGYLDPEQVIDPYDVYLGRMGVRERRLWASGVRADLMGRFPGQRFLVVAGAVYRLAVAGLPYECPVVGLSMGRMVSFLRRTA